VSSTLRQRSIGSISWVATAQLVRGTLLFAAPAVLANFVSADEMGLAEIAVAVFALVLMFIELGTGPAVIQRPELTQRFLSTVFFVNIATGLFVLLSLSIVQRNLLARRMKFRRITVVQVISGVVAAVVGLVALYQGGGLESLIAALGAYVAVGTVGFWIAGRWRPSLDFDRGELASLMRFSLSVSASSAINNLGVQLERFLIGGVLGAASLGVYGLARNLMLVPLRHLMKVSDAILLPALSSVQADKERTRSYYLSAVRYELATLGPIVVLVAVSSRELVSLAYGSGWEQTIMIVPLLAPLAWRQITAHTIGAVFLSQGRPDVQLRWVLYSLPLKVTYFVIGMPWGPAGVAASLSLFGVVGWVIGHTMANRLIDLRFARFVRALVSPLVSQVILAGALVVVKARVAEAFGVSGLTWVLLAAPLALAIYIPVLAVLDPGLMAGVRRLMWDLFTSAGDETPQPQQPD